MGTVLTFTPRSRPAAPELPQAMSPAEKRTRLEEALQTSLDVADHIIAVLDQWDGDADLEPDADAEPSLGAPEDHVLQVGWGRGGGGDREAEAPETVLPVVSLPEIVQPAELVTLPPTRWNGAGNVISATGIAILDLVRA